MHALLEHFPQHRHVLIGKQLRLLLLQLEDDAAEQPQVRVLVAVDVADLLRAAGHFAHACEVVEEHESGIEIHALQDEVRHEDAQERARVAALLELVVQVADERVAREQVLVGLPLVQNLIALGGVADGVEHVRIALRMHALLERLDREAEIHLVGRDVLGDVGKVRRLQGVEEHEERQDFVIGGALGGGEVRVIFNVLGEVDFLGDPKVVHRLAVPA